MGFRTGEAGTELPRPPAVSCSGGHSTSCGGELTCWLAGATWALCAPPLTAACGVSDLCAGSGWSWLVRESAPPPAAAAAAGGAAVPPVGPTIPVAQASAASGAAEVGGAGGAALLCG